MVAEMELGFIKARQRDGIERAKSKGDVYKGRNPTIDRSAVRDLFNEGIGASGNCTASQDWPRLHQCPRRPYRIERAVMVPRTPRSLGVAGFLQNPIRNWKAG
jgi:hypothetical protein